MEEKTISLCCGRRGCPLVMVKEKQVIICDDNHSVFLSLDEFEKLKRLIKEEKI